MHHYHGQHELDLITLALFWLLLITGGATDYPTPEPQLQQQRPVEPVTYDTLMPMLDISNWKREAK